MVYNHAVAVYYLITLAHGIAYINNQLLNVDPVLYFKMIWENTICEKKLFLEMSMVELKSLLLR